MNIKRESFIYFKKGDLIKLKNFNSDCFSYLRILSININIRYPNPLETYKVAKKSLISR